MTQMKKSELNLIDILLKKKKNRFDYKPVQHLTYQILKPSVI